MRYEICGSLVSAGEYSCLRTILILRREFSYYLLQLYIPSFMLVIVSWVSFWLDKDSVPARVTLGVTTLLTMTTQASGVNAKLPPVSYTKAIDVWIGVCLAFIFGALLEFALVNYAARKDIMRNVGGASRRGAPNRKPPPSATTAVDMIETGNTSNDQINYNTFSMVKHFTNVSKFFCVGRCRLLGYLGAIFVARSEKFVSLCILFRPNFSTKCIAKMNFCDLFLNLDEIRS